MSICVLISKINSSAIRHRTFSNIISLFIEIAIATALSISYPKKRYCSIPINNSPFSGQPLNFPITHTKFFHPVIFLLLLVLGTPALGATIGTPLYQPKPPRGDIDYQQGLTALSQGDLDMAKSAFLATLQKTPAHVGAMVGLAEIALKEGNSKVSEQ